jgi:hypothetical protein
MEMLMVGVSSARSSMSLYAFATARVVDLRMGMRGHACMQMEHQGLLPLKFQP